MRADPPQSSHSPTLVPCKEGVASNDMKHEPQLGWGTWEIATPINPQRKRPINHGQSTVVHLPQPPPSHTARSLSSPATQQRAAAEVSCSRHRPAHYLWLERGMGLGITQQTMIRAWQQHKSGRGINKRCFTGSNTPSATEDQTPY